MKINDTLITTIIGDITKADYVDAIVNPTNSKMTANGGLNKAIHKAAGDNLQKACEKLGHCAVGGAKATDAYNLPCKYIIHTVGPVWQDGKHNEQELLRSCYQNVLETARGLHIRTIGFSSISTGKHGFPVDKAAEIAIKETVRFVRENPQSFDKIVWIIRNEETKKAYDKEIKAHEVVETVKENVHLANVPIKAINWNDIIIYGSAVASMLKGKHAKRVLGLVRYIELSGNVKTTIIPGAIVNDGGWFYAGKATIEELQEKSVLLCRTILQEDSTGMNLTKELHADYSTYLRQHGYINTHKVVPTDMQRITILAMIINNNNIPPEHLIEHLINIEPCTHLPEKITAKIKKDIEFIREFIEANPH